MENVDFWYMPNHYNVTNAPFIAARFIPGNTCSLDTTLNATGKEYIPDYVLFIFIWS